MTRMTTVARVMRVTLVMRVTRVAGGNRLAGESYPIILFEILQPSEFGVEEGDQSNWGNQVDGVTGVNRMTRVRYLS